MRRLLSGWLAAVASSLAAQPALAVAPQQDLADWAARPVVVLMLEQEWAALQGVVGTDAERDFIDWFWSQRDPRPATALNEFRNEFFDRLAYADKEFSEVGVAGWASARGRLFLLLGPPHEVRVSSRHVPVDGAYRRLTVWEYSHPDNGRPVSFRFARTRSGTRLVVTGGRLSDEQVSCLEAARARLVANPSTSRFGAPIDRSSDRLSGSVATREAGGGVLATLAVPLTSLLGEPFGESIRYRFEVATTSRKDRGGQELPAGTLEIELGPDDFAIWGGFDLHIAVWMPHGVEAYRITEMITGRTVSMAAIAAESMEPRIAVARRLATTALGSNLGVAIAYLPTCPIRRPQAEAFLVELKPPFSDPVQPLPGGRLALSAVSINER